VTTTEEFAWAAGFFDAEGSVVLRRQRCSWRLELEVTQGGDTIPAVLHRIHAAFAGRGTITGPRRGYLYYWRASSRADIDAVARILAPWITEPKRSELESAGRQVGRALLFSPSLRALAGNGTLSSPGPPASSVATVRRRPGATAAMGPSTGR